MINLNLTESELVFLQRLIGHNMTYRSAPPNLYGKIADKTDKLGITSQTPLNLVDVSQDSWYHAAGDNRILLKVDE